MCVLVCGAVAAGDAAWAQGGKPLPPSSPAEASLAQPPFDAAALTPKTLASQALDRIRFERSEALAFDDSRFITAHLLDRHGFVWLASESGLFRFDGYAMRRYGPDPADPASLPSEVIYGLAEAPDGALWLAAVPGPLVRFDPVTGEAASFAVPQGQRHRRVAVDSTGIVWLLSQPSLGAVTEHRLYRFDPATATASEVALEAEGAPVVGVVDMEADREGHLWLAVADGGMLRYDVYAGRIHRYDEVQENEGAYAGLRISTGGTVWVQTRRGLYEYDPGQDRFLFRVDQRLLSEAGNPFLSGCYVDALRVAWCYRADVGDLVTVDVDTGARRVFTYDRADPQGIPGLGITRVFEDGAGVLWVAGTGGVRRVTGRQGFFVRVNNAPATFLRVGTDRDGGLLVAEFCGDVYRLDGALLERHPLVPAGLDLCAMTATETSDGAVWVGTWPWLRSGGVYRFDPDGTYRYFAHDPDDPTTLGLNGVRAVLEDRAGRIWVGTAGSLDRYDPATQTFSRAPVAPPGFSGDDVWALAEAADGTLWVSFYTRGVDRYDPETGRVVARYRHSRTDLATIGADVISWVEPSRADTGTVWLATWGGGLNRLDTSTGAVQRLTMRDGIPALRVNQVLEDDVGRIWASTPGGLVRHDPATGAMRVYGQADGLRAYAGLSGLARLSDGRFALTDGRGFASNGQLFLFHPDSLQVEGTTVPLALTALDVLGQPRPVAPQPDELRLAPDEDVFGVEFAALNFADAERIRYRHRLDGVDDAWVEDGTRRYAAYTNLQPGRYTFRVEADLGAGWGPGLRVPVVVEPHWWETALARIAALLAVVAGVSLVARTLATRRLRAQLRRLEVERRLQDERERISQDLHDHVGAQLSTIVSGIDLARLAANAPDQGDGAPPASASDYLDRLETHARTTMAQLRETIWALHHETVTLQAFFDRLCQHARAQAALRACAPAVACRLQAADAGRALSPMQALHLYRIAQEAIENALKHAEATRLAVEVRATTHSFVLVVEDDGAFVSTTGAEADDLRGFGLDGMRRRTERMGGQFALSIDHGTTVRVEVPWTATASGTGSTD